MNKPRVLLLSNGAGEDSIAVLIAQALQQVTIQAMPLVGLGSSYAGIIEVVGPRRVMPSGGLVPEGLQNLSSDIGGGLIGLIAQQVSWLFRHRHDYELIVPVGDLWPVVVAGLAQVRPILFVGTAKSNYHHRYSWLEAAVLRWFKVRCLVRDMPTAQSLAARGISAAWLGNCMMDAVKPEQIDLGIRANEAGLALFPGSRQVTYEVMPQLLDIVELFASKIGADQPKLCPLVALAPSIEVERLAQACPGYKVSYTDASRGVIGYLQKSDVKFRLVKNALGDLLRVSRLGLGLAGTAHEQAAGTGVPVVSWADDCANLGWYRGRQQGLLGQALQVVPNDNALVAEKLLSLWTNPTELQRLGEIGKQRLGPAGACRGMAKVIELMAGGEQLNSQQLQDCSCLELVQ